MKEKLRNKKVVYTIIGIVSVLLVALAVTYAYWLVTKTQTGENEITAGCLDISISGEKNDIELTNQFPMSDEDGMKLVPYEFTVTNNCNTSVDYQVALEATGTESSALKATSLKVALNDSYKLYSAYPSVETTISGAYESRVIGYSKLAASGTEGSSTTYSLRIWIDKDAPISEMNKTFKSKISVTIGQGIESPYEEGTIAYDILANSGGVNAISEIDANELDHRIIKTGSQYISPSDNYYYGTEYTFDETTGKYTLSGTLIQAKTSECRSGTKTCGKYTLKQTTSTSTSATLYEVTDFQSSGTNVTANTIQYTTPFGAITTASEAGLYKTQDDLGDTYYFRGNVTNNYIQFGTYTSDYARVRGYYTSTSTSYREYTTLEECNSAATHNYNCSEYKYAEAGSPIYWRIIRINGDGTIRLVYDGTTKAENGIMHESNIARSAFNSNSVGYTYDDGTGTQVDSVIKGVVDAWYDNHLETTYGGFIADGIFCNDEDSLNTDGYYSSYYRLNVHSSPKLTCSKSYPFSVVVSYHILLFINIFPPNVKLAEYTLSFGSSFSKTSGLLSSLFF